MKQKIIDTLELKYSSGFIYDITKVIQTFMRFGIENCKNIFMEDFDKVYQVYNEYLVLKYGG